MAQIRLGDLLIRAGVANDQQIEAALAEQKKWGGRLGNILVRMGVLTEDLLVKALAKQLGIGRAQIGPSDPFQVPAQILERLDRYSCERLGVVPVQYVADRRVLQVAISDPFNVAVIDDLSKRVGTRIEPLIAGETQILQAIGRLFGGTSVDAPTHGGDGMALSLVDNAGNHRAGTDAFAPLPQAVSSALSPGASGSGQAAAPTTSTVGRPNSNADQSGLNPQQEELRLTAEHQLRAYHALLELLVERGVVSRAEAEAVWPR